MAGKDEKQRRIFFALALSIMAFLVFRYAVVNALAALIPLLVALAVSALLRPAADVFSKRTKIPKKVCGGVISVLTVLFVGFISVIITVKLVNELVGFLGGLLSGLEKEDNVLRRLIDFFINLRERIPLFEKLGAAVGPDAADRIYSAATDGLRTSAHCKGRRQGTQKDKRRGRRNTEAKPFASRGGWTEGGTRQPGSAYSANSA